MHFSPHSQKSIYEKKMGSDYYDLTYFLMVSNSSKTQKQRGTSNDHKAWHLLLDVHSFSDKTSILKPTVSLMSTFLLSHHTPLTLWSSSGTLQKLLCDTPCHLQGHLSTAVIQAQFGTAGNKRDPKQQEGKVSLTGLQGSSR